MTCPWKGLSWFIQHWRRKALVFHNTILMACQRSWCPKLLHVGSYNLRELDLESTWIWQACFLSTFWGGFKLCIDVFRYVVTFSPLMDTKDDPQAIIIWDVLTGQKKRGFHCESSAHWPIFKWVLGPLKPLGVLLTGCSAWTDPTVLGNVSDTFSEVSFSFLSQVESWWEVLCPDVSGYAQHLWDTCMFFNT